MPTLDGGPPNGLPTAAAVSLADLLAVCQGSTGPSGSGTLRAATVGQLVASIGGPYLPTAGGTLTGGLTAAAITTGNSLEFTGPGGGSTRTWNGTSNTQVPINAGDGFLTWNGTVPSNLGGLAPLWMTAGLVPNVNAAVTGGVVMDSLFISPGPATTGGVTGSFRIINIAATSSNTTTVEYVPARTQISAYVNDGGTALAAQGSIIAGTDVAALYTGATYWRNINVREFALKAQVGTSVLQKIGTYTMLYSDDAVQGSGLDAAQGFWNQAQSSSTRGWQVLWNLGNSNLGRFNPLASNGILMRFDPNTGGDTLTIGSLFELAGWTTITNNILNTATMKINGAGSVYATDFRVFGSGNGPMDLYSLGDGGFLFKTTDTPGGGALLSVANSAPGTTVTSGFNLTAGAGFAELTLSGTNPQFFIASSGTGYIGFQSGAPTRIDYLGNITAPSLGLNGSTSGTISLLAAAIAGSNTVTVPAATGTMAVYGAEAAATTPVAFSAAARIPIVIGGTTYYIPLGTVAW